MNNRTLDTIWIMGLLFTLTIALVVVLSGLDNYFKNHPSSTTPVEPARNEFIVTGKEHVRNVICNYQVMSSDSTQTVRITDACSKWDVTTKLIFKTK